MLFVSKEFIASDSQELFLFDLELENVTINQGLTVNEESGEFYATQVYNNFNRSVESFIVTRTSLGGKKLDSMIFRDGGHGTSIGVENVKGKSYIWTNMIDLNNDGSINTQWLCRIPYLAGETVSIKDSKVERIIEFPDRKRYQTPFTDSKNGLIALRITDTNSGTNKSEIQVYKTDDLKNGIFNNVIYSYKFTNDMNSKILQGLAIDNNKLYITFGDRAENFHLYCIDLVTGKIIDEINRAIGHAPDGRYIRGFGEPEGLYLYTDPYSGYKTLLTVIVGDEVGRRRQRLFALSSNIGVQKFLGLSAESVQRVPLTRHDNKAKRIDISKINSLKQIIEPGSYYLTTAEGNKMDDHPMKNVAGWWLYVSGGDTTRNHVSGCHQILARNSSVHGTMFVRTVIGNAKGASPWFKLDMKKL